MNQVKKSAPARRIAHLDMDAFFASVSLLRYPQLKGLPVVIGGARKAQDDILKRIRAIDPDWDDERPRKFPVRYFPTLSSYTGRGVITTATYEARQFGIGSAMGLMKAAKLCPQAILLPVDFEQYQKYSKQFKEIISEIAPLMENRGIDEVYIDLTEVPGVWRSEGKVLARVIQQTIYSNTGLTCSIGVAPNKLLAKMASEIHKPNGITIIRDADIEAFLWPMPCSKVPGIGPKTHAKLIEFGIITVGDLAQQLPLRPLWPLTRMNGCAWVVLPFTLSTFWPIRPIKIAENPLIGVFKLVRPPLSSP